MRNKSFHSVAATLMWGWQPCKLLILRGTHSHNSRRSYQESDVSDHFESGAPRERKDHLSCSILFPNFTIAAIAAGAPVVIAVTAQLLSFRVVPALRRRLSSVERQLEVIETNLKGQTPQ